MTSQKPLKAAAALLLAVLAPATLRHAPAAFAQSATAGDDLAVLRGRIVAADASARPLPGARVTVVGSERNTLVVSDREGRFETRVPARGNWSLHVTKAGFAPAQLTNATGDDATIIRMTPGAAVIGRVVDQRGDPVPGAVVRLRPADCAAPCPLDLPAVAATASLAGETDDLGEFRIGSLPSGRYEVSISMGSAVLPSGIDAAAIASMEAFAAGLRRLRSVAGSVAPNAAADRTESPAPEFVDLRPGEETVIYHVLDTTPAPDGGVPPESAATRRGATIAGRIVGPGGRPVDGARVQVIHTDGTESQTTRSNVDGRYAVTGLDAGSFRLQVTSAGLPPVEYGQQHSQQQGAPIVVRGRETVSGIDVQLPRGGVISGRVVDVHGDPIEGLNVQVWQRQFTGGRTALVAPGGVRADRTDDRGQYRIYGLLPGTYYIVASEPSTVVSNMRTTRTSGSEAEALAERYRAALGGRGNVEMSVRPNGQISVSVRVSSSPSLTQSRVFYPGSVAPEQALSVRIEPGLDGHGADIVFAPPLAARISGVALDSSGQPASGVATLAVSQRSGALAVPARGAAVSDGTFEFLDVPPGDYVLQVQARSMAPAAPSAQQSGAPTAPRRNPNSGDPEFGMQYVTVSSATDAEVSIRTAPFSHLTARVIAEGGGSSVSREGFVFGAVAADLDRSPSSMRPEAALREDWTFDLGSLTGPIRLELRRAPPGWYLKSAHIAGIDAAEFPVTLPAADPALRWAPTRLSASVADVVIARAGEISGRALSERGEPATDYAVVVFPVDPARWYDRSRYLKMTRTIRDGTFTVTGLPPGEYWVAAVDRVLGQDAGGEWQRPEVLSSLTTGASRIRVAEGQQVSTDLRLMRMSW